MTSEPSSVLVCEYLSAGGRLESSGSAAPDATSTREEGEVMLRALLEDLAPAARSRGPRVAALAAPELRTPWPEGIERILCRGDPIAAVARELAAGGGRRHDRLWAIAPETRGILRELALTAERAGVRLAGPSSGAIGRAADRAGLLERLARAGVPVPEGGPAASPPEARRRLRTLGGDVVVKPGRGAGGEGTTRLAGDGRGGSPRRVEAAWRRARAVEPGLAPLVQRHVPGTPASVALLVDDGGIHPLGLFRQRVRFAAAPGRREGPWLLRTAGPPIPLRHASADVAFRVARRAVRACGGLRGIIGVDVVLAGSGPVALEINPRLTTAFAALAARDGPGLAARALDRPELTPRRRVPR